jgi:hypothetical protein
MQIVRPFPDVAPTVERTPASEAIGTFTSSLVSAVEDLVQAMSPPAASPRARGRTARTRTSSWSRPDRGRCGCPEHHDCRCEPCRDDPCECVCCLGDVDLAVYARLGERRVVPVEITNPRRREREIGLELSGFTTRGGRPSGVTGRILPQPEGPITLGPCAAHEAILIVEVGLPGDKATDLQALGKGDEARTPDVDDCVVATADLRVSGCDIRPLRIAVAVLPRHCAAYQVNCGSDCCC